jgi:DNA replication initiation complex subunit (GINS family)
VREVEAEIEEALKAERTSQELAKLPEDFYTRISHFLATLVKKEAEGLEKEELEEKSPRSSPQKASRKSSAL